LNKKLFKGIPEDSRASKDGRYLKETKLNGSFDRWVDNKTGLQIGRNRACEMAIAWLLESSRISTVLVGVSRTEQLLDNIEV